MRLRTLAVLLLLFGSDLLLSASLGADQPPSSKMEKALARLADLDAAESAVWAEEHEIRYDVQIHAVQAIVELRSGASPASVTSQLEQHHVRVEAQNSQLLRVSIPTQHLEEIASLEDVSFIRRPYTFRELDLAENRGVLKTGAQLLHSYGFQGQQVKIAVIDGGFQGLAKAMKTGDLPSSSISDMIDYTGEGLEEETEHGLQVAEIANEMAPGASLILMRVGDEVDLGNAVDDAIRLGARIISHSLGWFDSNFGDGKGLVDEIAKRALNAGVLWVNAAGNQATNHWMGLARVNNNNEWIEFAPGVNDLEIYATFPGEIDLVLVWDEWPITYQDFDLYLTDWKDNVIASSEEDQMGLAPPREMIQHFVAQPGLYKVKVKARRVSKPVRLKVWSLNSEHSLSPAVAAGSVVAPADCTCTLAVGAINVFQWEKGWAEFYSAQGPTSDGRIKPDLLAPDNIRGFSGTSAAAPGVAGAAATLLSEHPEWDVNELEAALEAQTVDLYEPGKDNFSGYGRMQLSLASPQASRALSTTQVHPGEDVVVTLTAQMPASHFGTFEWVESVPRQLVVAGIEADGAQVSFQKDSDPMQIRWLWSAVGPGERRRATYHIHVPNEASPAQYELSGSLNGLTVTGDTTLAVHYEARSAQITNRPVITTQITKRAIEFHFNRLIQTGIERLDVQIFNLDGHAQSSSQLSPGQHMAIPLGRHWANGIYLYRVIYRDIAGKMLGQEIKKLILLR
ncbi:S8 family serine peptidase [Candidatus Acetothermia bacterium]|nr:S8 family serine peptidase [Candidatus Acetothermia bacterium]